MAIVINRDIMARVLDNSDFVKESFIILNNFVDIELEKDDNEIDFDLIEECTDAILALKLGIENPASVVFPLVSSKKFLSKVGAVGWRSLSKGARIILIAAAVFAATITASAAAVGNITGNSIIENIIPTTASTIVSEKASETSTVENTSESETEKTTKEKATENTLHDDNHDDNHDNSHDDSIVVKKAESPKKGRFACYETAGQDEFNPKCHYESVSFNPDNKINYPWSFKEKISNKNTAFNEAEYKKKYCKNSVCNSETGELHNFGEWYVTKSPTCTELGEQVRICYVCGEEQSCPVKATGEHDYLRASVKQADTDKNFYLNFKMYDGSVKYKCRLCEAEKEKTIARAKYIVIDQYEFEYDGKAHRPKVYAVLDKNKKVIPGGEYEVVYLDNGGAKDIYNDYGVYAEMHSEYYAQPIEIRFRIIPDTVQLTGVLTGDGTLVPTWKKAKFTKNVDKAIYEIQYSRKKEFSGAKTVKAYGSAQKVVISDVEKGATYYVRVRGVSDFSPNLTVPKGHWSEVRKITVK